MENFKKMEKDLAETSERVKELQQESIQMKEDITSLYNRAGYFFTIITHQLLELDLIDYIMSLVNDKFR